jgi:signal transduction histidine kinase
LCSPGRPELTIFADAPEHDKYDPQMRALWRSLNRRSQAAGYAAGIAIPIGMTYTLGWLGWPPFIFEQLVVMLVVGIAIPWGLGPAILAAAASVVSHHVLLREPLGGATITGARDAVDLLLFGAVAVVISELVRRAHAARLIAEQAAERERRAREDRERLIATVTHDLATPLSVLSGTVQFLKRHGTASQGDLSRLLGRIETASARATSLVRTLADAQALESEDFGLRTDTHDLRVLVHPIVQMMDRFSERHPIVLEMPDRAVHVNADGDRFQRVLENLINNAIKYSPDGGAVEVSISSEAHDAVICVRDYGIGISPEALPRIFEPAYRAREAATCAPGLGLGLSIAAQVVARHGGTIAAAPADGRGTTVTVRLPLASVPRHDRHAGAGAQTAST